MKKKQKKSKFSIFLITVDIFVLICFFVAYGPFSFFRDFIVTTAMTTMTHKYFAYVLYSESMVEEILDNNKVIETEDPTDTSKINIKPIVDTGTYESIYEEQVLKKDDGNDLYKVVDISGSGWKGYMVVVYDPSRIELVFSKKYGKGGEYLSTMAKNNNAYVAMNASGVNSVPRQNYVTGQTILNGKVYKSGRHINKGGGLVGFTKDNVLMLTKKTASEAVKDGMDRAVEFGPFLVVNGKMSDFKGNGGWGIANRTAIGQRQDGIVLFIVIDGRTSSSVGISMKNLAELFVKYKAYNASNLDGGGSSALYAKRNITDKTGKLLNTPKGYNYSGERFLPNAWMVRDLIDDNKKSDVTTTTKKSDNVTTTKASTTKKTTKVSTTKKTTTTKKVTTTSIAKTTTTKAVSEDNNDSN
ncbi:MAG: phosphodiester glycosidase family protein [Tenericutes bacterium]|nr:phosphodiester glycosidase family protein [Mycoplasmatota bacterium]